MKNFVDRQRSKRALRAGVGDAAVVAVGLAILIALAATWFYRKGFILYYGDAQAHLNISRGLIDSRTPGYDQLGTVWLPMLHLLCLPFVGKTWLWTTGLAGTLPVAFCFVIAGMGFYVAAREAYGSKLAAVVMVLCFALNPNVLYLASIPMTEIVFLAGEAMLMFAGLRYRTDRGNGWLILGVLCCWFTSLTRYDGWFLIPFAAAWFAYQAGSHRLRISFVFATLAALAPCYWFVHNWFETSNALDFFTGPYSPVAIQGKSTYPGLHDWSKALVYYGEAARLCSGNPLCWLGLAGGLCALAKRVILPSLFLLLTPLFYLWSMHSSGGSPIHVPDLWPHSYYNTRYGIALVPFCAFAAGAIVLVLPEKLSKLAVLIPAVAVAFWIRHSSPEDWICWKESEVNSSSRRAWTAEAAAYLAAHYSTGQGILSGSGDIPGIYCRAGIPLSETLNIGNGPAWLAATTRPDLYHPTQWQIAQDRGRNARDGNAQALDSIFKPVLVLRTKDDPTLFVSSRIDHAAYTLH